MKNKLPKKFKDKWVTALQSGEYKQTTGKLGSVEEGFCCLGLACHISGLKFHSKAKVIKYKHKNYYGNTFTIEGVSKIPRLLKGEACENDIVSKLVDMNDNGNCTFFEIGEWIKENL